MIAEHLCQLSGIGPVTAWTRSTEVLSSNEPIWTSSPVFSERGGIENLVPLEIEKMQEPMPTKFASVRDGFAALRELILVVALLALLFTPTTVRQVLQDAGIRSFAGVEFDEETLNEVENAGVRVAELEQQLALAQQQLDAVAKITPNRADPRLGTVSRLLADAQRNASQMGVNLEDAKDKQIELWRRAGQPSRGHGRQSSPTTTDPEIEQALVAPELLFDR